ncbi:MAG: NADPH-dependent 7-cyano-7-deazaguanine reductase QueF, partial [Bacteroidales bacterium]|nr:NADPH-dependent 7-cyano-7-deazaguanine reductase QueF [Bacteroidales bacterium]
AGKPQLGAATEYPRHYDPGLLVPIPRAEGRAAFGSIAFRGVDLWTAYELSWLNDRGRPCVAIAEFRVSCDSPNIVESKSFKLYLNSLNQARLAAPERLVATLVEDLGGAFGAAVEVTLYSLDEYAARGLWRPEGECLDEIDTECEHFSPAPELLAAAGAVVEETLYSHLLKSNCPVTDQPDWATVVIRYRGPAIHRQGLLRYIVSFRQHQGFHEHCVERIFSDLMERCAPEWLEVHARYTRRGGLDINPSRGSRPLLALPRRDARQ